MEHRGAHREITSVVSERFGGIGEAINNRLGGVPGRIGEFASSVTGRLGIAAEMGVNAFKRKFNIGSHAEGEGSKLSAAFGKIKGAAGNMGGVLVKAAEVSPPLPGTSGGGVRSRGLRCRS